MRIGGVFGLHIRGEEKANFFHSQVSAQKLLAAILQKAKYFFAEFVGLRAFGYVDVKICSGFANGLQGSSGRAFAEEADNGAEDIRWILEGQDYTRLWWEAITDDVTDFKA